MIPNPETLLYEYQKTISGAAVVAARCQSMRTAAVAADEHATAADRSLAALMSDATRAISPALLDATQNLRTVAGTLDHWSRAADSYSREVRPLVTRADSHWDELRRNQRALAEAQEEGVAGSGNATAYGYRLQALRERIEREGAALLAIIGRLHDEEEQLARALAEGQDRLGSRSSSSVRDFGARVHEINPRGDDDFMWQLIMMDAADKNPAGYDHVDLPLFNRDEDGNPVIRPEDVSQGSYGDCWFIATLMAVAAQRPEVIEQMISYDDASGMYTVTLYDKHLEPQQIQVDGRLLLDKDGYTYGAGKTEDKVLWPAIAEKALAEYMGGYPDIEGDRTSFGIRLVTGDDAIRTDYFTPGIVEWVDGYDTNPAHLAETLADGGVAVAWTKSYGNGETPEGLHGMHAYQVVGVDGDMVTVQNPWGTDKYPPIELDWDQFHDLFQGVSWTD